MAKLRRFKNTLLAKNATSAPQKFPLILVLWVTAGLALAIGIGALATNEMVTSDKKRVSIDQSYESLSQFARNLPPEALRSSPGLRSGQHQVVENAEKTIHERVLASHKPIIGPNGESTNSYLAQGAGTGNHYDWDAENRLIRVTYPGAENNSQFIYDPVGHFVKIIETRGGTVTDTKQFIWSGDELAEERDATGTVTKQFFNLGVRIGSSNHFYSKDHQDSIRELTDQSGTIVAEYQYDPWGVPTKIQGSMSTDMGFCRYYKHKPSGLYLTVHRPYNPSLGRFITRDPIHEAGGSNLYTYVGNSPINYYDPSGLAPFPGEWYPTQSGEFPFPSSGGVALPGGGVPVSYPGGRIIYPEPIPIPTARSVPVGTSKFCPPRGQLGDLTPAEISKIQAVVNQAGRPIDVVGSAARGVRITGSDIDYTTAPAWRQYFDPARLPGLDPKTGILRGGPNPFEGPSIRFEPGVPPVFIPKRQ